MPIGKNAIKRVENNGYSNVKTSAPDMENSNVIANPDPQVVAMLADLDAKADALKNKIDEIYDEKKPVAKKTAKKSPAKKSACNKAKKNGFERVSFGEDMPYYLL